MFWLTWEITVNCTETAALFYLLKARLGLLPRQQWRGWVGYVVVVLTMTWLNYLDVNVAIAMISLASVQLLWVLLCFGESWTKRVLWYLVSVAVPFLTNTLLSIGFMLSDSDMQASLLPTRVRFVTQILYLAITVTLCTVLTLFPKSKQLHAPGALRWVLLGIMSVDLICLASNLSILNDPYLSEETANGFVLDDFALLGTGIGIFLLFERLGVVMQQRLVLSEKLAQHAARKAEQERAETAARTWRHDMRRALEPIAFFLSRGDTEHIRKYFADLHITVDAMGAGIETGSVGLDAELNTRKTQARLLNIPMQITAQKLDFTGINEAQLGMAAANLLDNALEACQRVDPAEDRFIEVRLYSRGDMIVFEVLNSADGVYRRTDQSLLSTKEDGDHGHGYDQLQILIEECDGYYITEPRNDSFRVHVCLPKGEGRSTC